MFLPGKDIRKGREGRCMAELNCTIQRRLKGLQCGLSPLLSSVLWIAITHQCTGQWMFPTEKGEAAHKNF